MEGLPLHNKHLDELMRQVETYAVAGSLEGFTETGQTPLERLRSMEPLERTPDDIQAAVDAFDGTTATALADAESIYLIADDRQRTFPHDDRRKELTAAAYTNYRRCQARAQGWL